MMMISDGDVDDHDHDHDGDDHDHVVDDYGNFDDADYGNYYYYYEHDFDGDYYNNGQYIYSIYIDYFIAYIIYLSYYRFVISISIVTRQSLVHPHLMLPQIYQCN
jgi:hypothetical protein